MPKTPLSREFVPVGDFVARPPDWLRRISGSGQPLVITEDGQPAGVLLSLAAFERLSAQPEFLAAVQQGMADEVAGRGHTTQEVFDALERRIDAVEAE